MQTLLGVVSLKSTFKRISLYLHAYLLTHLLKRSGSTLDCLTTLDFPFFWYFLFWYIYFEWQNISQIEWKFFQLKILLWKVWISNLSHFVSLQKIQTFLLSPTFSPLQLLLWHWVIVGRAFTWKKIFFCLIFYHFT